MSGHAGHDMSSMAGAEASSTKDAHGAHALPMKSALGPYSMAREGSGTSWQPEATPMEGAALRRRRLGADGARLRQCHLRQADRARGATRSPSPRAWRCSWETGRSGPARSAFAPWSRSIRPWARAAIPCCSRPARRPMAWSTSSIDSTRTTSSWSCRRRTACRSAARDRRSPTSASRASPRSARRRSCTASRACATPRRR